MNAKKIERADVSLSPKHEGAPNSEGVLSDETLDRVSGGTTEYLAPGVFVEEQSFHSHPIPGVTSRSSSKATLTKITRRF